MFDRIADLDEVHLHDNFGPGLPPSIAASPSLGTLDVSNSRIQRLPDNLGSMPALENIDVRGCTDLQSLPRSVDLSRVSVLADPGSAIEEQALDRLYERAVSPAARPALAARAQDIASRLDRLQAMRASGKVDAQAWSRAQSLVAAESMKGSDTLTGDGLAAGAEIAQSQQCFRNAGDLVNRLSAGREPLRMAHLMEINREVGGGGTYHPNIRDHGDRYGSFRSARLSIVEQVGDDLLHPDPGRVAMLMQDLVDRVNLESVHLQGSPDLLAKVELAASAASQLLSIHPFPDGNGRTANQLMALILQQHGLPPPSMAPEAKRIVHPGLGSGNPSQEAMVESVLSGMERSLHVMESALAQPAAGSSPRPPTLRHS